jgi:hypothetical protein
MDFPVLRTHRRGANFGSTVTISAHAGGLSQCKM